MLSQDMIRHVALVEEEQILHWGPGRCLVMSLPHSTVLSDKPELSALDEIMPTLEHVVVLMYDRTTMCTQVNDARKALFTKKGRSMDAIPPTAAALVHTHQDSGISGWICMGQSITLAPATPSPAEWGWKRSATQSWDIIWTTLEDASKSCQQPIKCGCNPDRGCRGSYKCVNANMRCTALCTCSGDCEQQ